VIVSRGYGHPLDSAMSLAVRRPPDAVQERRATHDESDAELLSRVGAGEIAALGVLYDRHHESVRRFALRATGRSADADDIAHEAFLSLSRIADRFDGRASARPLLVGIASKLVLARRRSLARWTEVLRAFGQAATDRSGPSPEGIASAAQEIRRFDDALMRLPPGKRVVVLMVDGEGMSGEEVAAALGLPVGTVWTRLHYARSTLREALRTAPRH
jgi:RNA polymerase sigma-70 factor (ECF subfamily)